MSYNEAGKGDGPRPMEIDGDEFRRRFDKAFRTPKHTTSLRCPDCGSVVTFSVGWCRECGACGRKY